MRLRLLLLMAALAIGSSNWSFGAGAKTEKSSMDPAGRQRFVALLKTSKTTKSGKVASNVRSGSLRAFGGRVPISIINP